MRITILALGAPGDVQPVVAFALGLERAGHEVRLAAPPSSKDLVTAHGLEFAPLGRRPEPGATGPSVRWNARSMLAAGRLYVRSVFSRNAAPTWPVKLPFLERIMDDCWTACQQSDLILLCRHIPWFYHVVEATGIPYILWDIYPFTVTREFPSLHVFNVFRSWPRAATALSNWFGGRFNAWTHRIGERLLFDVSVRLTNPWRQERLKLPPVTNTKPYAASGSADSMVLYAFSRLVAAPSDWPASHHLTGYWFLDRPVEWQAPANLLQFLSAGAPPICFYFARHNPKNYVATIIAALKQTPFRAIVLAPKESLGGATVPDNVLVIDSIPHDWLFQRTSAVVHQGDTTTTGEVLRAGVPSVVVLSGRGMLFWADRLYKLGVAPMPIAKGGLSPTTLTAVLRSTLENSALRERAAALSRQIQAEDGVAQAVELLRLHSGTRRNQSCS